MSSMTSTLEMEKQQKNKTGHETLAGGCEDPQFLWLKGKQIKKPSEIDSDKR